MPFSRYFSRFARVKEIINDSTDGLTFYSQPAMTVDAADLKQLYPMVKTPQWFQSYQDTMGNHGCKETIFQDPIEAVDLVALTLALNYGKFRRYVTREEVGEWAKNFNIEALKEAKANLKGRIAEIGHIKKAWEKPVQGTSLYRAKLPDELSASMICLPETVKKLKVKGDHVAMLPVASVLYVTGSKDDDGLKLMCDLALDYLNYPHFLTLQPIRLAGKHEVAGKGYHWTLFDHPVIESKMAAASVNLFVSPQPKKREETNHKSRPASFFSTLSSKIQAGLRSPLKGKRGSSAADSGAASQTPTPANEDDFNEDSFISNGISNGHDTTLEEEGSVQSVVANPNAAMAAAYGGVVDGAAVRDDAVVAAGTVDAEKKDDTGTKDGGKSTTKPAEDGALESSLEKSEESFDSFVHVSMSDLPTDQTPPKTDSFAADRTPPRLVVDEPLLLETEATSDAPKGFFGKKKSKKEKEEKDKEKEQFKREKELAKKDKQNEKEQAKKEREQSKKEKELSKKEKELSKKKDNKSGPEKDGKVVETAVTSLAAAAPTLTAAAAATEKDGDVVVQQVVPKEVQMQLLASAIDGEDIVIEANEAVQESKAPPTADVVVIENEVECLVAATPILAAPPAAATNIAAVTTTAAKTPKEAGGKKVPSEEHKDDEKKSDSSAKKVSQKKKKSSASKSKEEDVAADAADVAASAPAVTMEPQSKSTSKEKTKSPMPQAEKNVFAGGAAAAAEAVFAAARPRESAKGDKRKEKTPTKKEEKSERNKSDGGGGGGGGGGRRRASEGDGKDEKRRSVGGGSGDGGRDRDDDSGRSNNGAGAMAALQAEQCLGLSEADVWLEKPRYEAAEVQLAAALASIAKEKSKDASSSISIKSCSATSVEPLLARPVFEEALSLSAKQQTPSSLSSPSSSSPLAMESIWFDQSKYEEAYNLFAMASASSSSSGVGVSAIDTELSSSTGLPYPFYIAGPKDAKASAKITASSATSIAKDSSPKATKKTTQSYEKELGRQKNEFSRQDIFLRGLAQEKIWFDGSQFEDAMIKKMAGGKKETSPLDRLYAGGSSSTADVAASSAAASASSAAAASAASAGVVSPASLVGRLSVESIWFEQNVYEKAEAAHRLVAAAAAEKTRKSAVTSTTTAAAAPAAAASVGKAQACKKEKTPPRKEISLSPKPVAMNEEVKKVDEEEEEDAFDFFTAVPLGSAAREAEKEMEKGSFKVEEEEEEEEEEDAFDFFTAVPLGSAAREVEKANERAIIEEEDEEEDAFDFFSPVPLGSAAREAEKAKEKALIEEEEEEEEEDAFDFFTAVPLGSAAREEEKAREKAIVEEKEEEEEEEDAFDFFTAVPLGSAAREAEKAQEKAMEEEEEEEDAFDFFSAVPIGSAAREAEKAAATKKAPTASVEEVEEEDEEEIDAFDLFTPVPLGSKAREREIEEQRREEEEEVDAFDLLTAVPLGSAARDAEKAAEEQEEDEIDAFDMFTAVPIGSAAREAEIEEEKMRKETSPAILKKRAEEEVSALFSARQAASDAQKAILEAKQVLAQAGPKQAKVSYAAATATGGVSAPAAGVFSAAPVSASAFNAATAKAKSPVPAPKVAAAKREGVPSQESFTFKAGSPNPAEGKTTNQRKSSKEKSPPKPTKTNQEAQPSLDGDAPQNRKRKANSQMQKLGVTPAPPPAATLTNCVNGGINGGVNGLHVATSPSPTTTTTTVDHVTSKEAIVSPQISAKEKNRANQDAKGGEKLFGDGPIVLNERTLRLLGLSESGWNSLLLKSRLSGGVLPLETTFICFECGRDAVAEKKRLMKCKRCKVASYCDANCQGVNWASHKRVCKVVGSHKHADEVADQNIFCN